MLTDTVQKVKLPKNNALILKGQKDEHIHTKITVATWPFTQVFWSTPSSIIVSSTFTLEQSTLLSPKLSFHSTI